MKRFLFSLVMMVLWINCTAQAEMPKGEFLEGKNSTVAVILAHGRGLGPDTQVVGPLRKAINKELGFHTLSLQMPVLINTNFQAYASTFPDAYKLIQSAIDYLTSEKGVKRIYLMGYSMGARMTTAFLGQNPTPAIIGYIGVGLLQGGGNPLDANQNLLNIRVPVLDVFADQTPHDLKSAENRRFQVSDTFKQIKISGAEHSFRGFEEQVNQAVTSWLKEREGNAAR